MDGTWYYLEGQTDHLNFVTPSLTTHFSPCTGACTGARTG